MGAHGSDPGWLDVAASLVRPVVVAVLIIAGFVLAVTFITILASP